MTKADDNSEEINKEMSDILYKIVVKKDGLKQFSDSKHLYRVIANVLKEHSDKVADYIYTRDKWLKFFIGQVMKATKGQANPHQTRSAIKQRLGEITLEAA